ncbi:hypothetical protein L2E82_48417 [Cichorium intybus]|uniref:Uncharacterized protein n=1 Tax=Cichorium intybus TaxID=13427 RepID=A0ACB8YZ60_CICIN|nr:hypothetical protein L2E82_48417 [Cichorium intybus]
MLFESSASADCVSNCWIYRDVVDFAPPPYHGFPLSRCRLLHRSSSFPFPPPSMVTIKFQIHPTCKIALFISNIVANLGVKVKERATGSDMNLRAWDSGVAWQLTLNRPVDAN